MERGRLILLLPQYERDRPRFRLWAFILVRKPVCAEILQGEFRSPRFRLRMRELSDSSYNRPAVSTQRRTVLKARLPQLGREDERFNDNAPFYCIGLCIMSGSALATHERFAGLRPWCMGRSHRRAGRPTGRQRRPKCQTYCCAFIAGGGKGAATKSYRYLVSIRLVPCSTRNVIDAGGAARSTGPIGESLTSTGRSAPVDSRFASVISSVESVDLGVCTVRESLSG